MTTKVLLDFKVQINIDLDTDGRKVFIGDAVMRHLKQRLIRAFNESDELFEMNGDYMCDIISEETDYLVNTVYIHAVE